MKTEVGKYAPILPLLQKLKEGEKSKEEEIENKIAKSCINKGCYSKKEARTIKNSLRKEGKMLREYHCPKCNFWHLTHLIRENKKKNKKRH